MAFLIVGHCLRGDSVPHWLHAATMERLAKPCQFAHIYETHTFDIGRSRQLVAEMFLKVPEATHLLFVDDDIVIPKDDSLIRMFHVLEKLNASIVSGLYNRRDQTGIERDGIPLIMMCKDEGNGKLAFCFPFAQKLVPPKKLIKVDIVPAGFLLIKREVFEKIPAPWFVYGSSEFAEKHGEDVYFSLKAAKHGFSLWVDTYVELLHFVPQFIGNPELIKLVLRDSASLPMQLEEMRRCLSKKTENARNADGNSAATYV